MVLCLVGPPGVGKTTIAQAMAEALGRKFVRVALGGVHDEAELRGHRISFTAAQPGRSISAFAQVGTATPVVVLDEIDKLGTDKSRSPLGAMLELLDPAQNATFHDNFLATPFDLSRAIFICTANDADALHPTLRDRMEMVELDAYTTQEKVTIAREVMLEKLRARSGLPTRLPLADPSLERLIEGHTREPGVRQLERALSSLYRARALEVVERGGERDAVSTEVMARPVTEAEMLKVLGPARPKPTEREQALPPGVATALSVGSDGGGTLFVEVVRRRAQGNRQGAITCTGRMGEVMRESVETSVALLQRLGPKLGIDEALWHDELHVHAPDAATPKDGPSAGIALCAAVASVLLGKSVRADVAFTGEVTLRGRVLPVGGVRAKVLAAERAGLKTVLLPRQNLGEVPEGLSIKVVGVESIEEVLAQAFE